MNTKIKNAQSPYSNCGLAARTAGEFLNQNFSFFKPVRQLHINVDNPGVQNESTHVSKEAQARQVAFYHAEKVPQDDPNYNEVQKALAALKTAEQQTGEGSKAEKMAKAQELAQVLFKTGVSFHQLELKALGDGGLPTAGEKDNSVEPQLSPEDATYNALVAKRNELFEKKGKLHDSVSKARVSYDEAELSYESLKNVDERRKYSKAGETLILLNQEMALAKDANDSERQARTAEEITKYQDYEKQYKEYQSELEEAKKAMEEAKAAYDKAIKDETDCERDLVEVETQIGATYMHETPQAKKVEASPVAGVTPPASPEPVPADHSNKKEIQKL